MVVLPTVCQEIDPNLGVRVTDCQRLTYYAVGSRRPDDLFEPTKDEALAMAAAANRVREEIEARLP